jgi:diacylglycerol kinase family enzyme
MHVRELLKLYLRSTRNDGTLRLEIPGQPPVTNAHLAFVSNVDPWTYLGSRPIHTNPGTTIDGGLGVFALRSLSAATVTKVGTQLLRAAGNPHGSKVVRFDDVAGVTVCSALPIGFQADGDFLGKRTKVVFTSVPKALKVVL